jgi:subtilisin family serine protease
MFQIVAVIVFTVSASLSAIGCQRTHETVRGQGVTIAVVDYQSGNHGPMSVEIIRDIAPDATVQTSWIDTAPGVPKALRAAAQAKPNIVLVNTVNRQPDAATKPLIDELVAGGALVIAAAGNDGENGAVYYPAAWANVLAVGAMTQGGGLANYSQRQSYVALIAPGYSSVNGLSATSAAAPHVVGAAALVLSANPKLTATEVRQLLIDTAKPVCSEPGCGAGLIQVDAAVAMAQRR